MEVVLLALSVVRVVFLKFQKEQTPLVSSCRAVKKKVAELYIWITHRRVRIRVRGQNDKILKFYEMVRVPIQNTYRIGYEYVT